jgi:hypothetical protein
MAHAQKPDFVFRRNGRVNLNRRGASVQSTTGSRGVRISGSNAGYTMFRGSVKSTGYPLHSPVSPSLPFPCVTVCHHISTGLYKGWTWALLRYASPPPPHTHEPHGLPLRGDRLLAEAPRQKPYRQKYYHPLPDSGCRCSVATVTTEINPLHCCQRPSLARSPFWVVVMQPPIRAL